MELWTKAKTEANDNIAELERRVNVMIENLNYEVARKKRAYYIFRQNQQKSHVSEFFHSHAENYEVFSVLTRFLKLCFFTRKFSCPKKADMLGSKEE